MQPTQRYELLPSLPCYGPMYIPVTDDGTPYYAEGFVVRFYRTDGTEWVANLEPGCSDLKEIIEFEQFKYLLVIALGTCYLMDPDNTKPIKVFGMAYSKIFKADNGRIVLQDEIDFTIMEADGTFRHTERISWGGFAETSVENNAIKGLAYTPTADADEWSQFTYNLDTKILTGGTYNFPKKKKPRWRFWHHP